MSKVAVETFFYMNGGTEVNVQAGDVRADAHADVTKLPSAFVTDPPANAAELAKVPPKVKRNRGY
jgi:hypothetical protein